MKAKEVERRKKHQQQKLRIKPGGKHSYNRNRPNIVTISTEDEDDKDDDQIGCDLKNYGKEKGQLPKADRQSDTTSSIDECLVFAKDVSEIFNDCVLSEQKKWKKSTKSTFDSNKTSTNDDAEPVVDEALVWKHAKRVARMIAIAHKNLDHLGVILAENVAKECPNFNVKKIKELTISNTCTAIDSSLSSINKGKLDIVIVW